MISCSLAALVLAWQAAVVVCAEDVRPIRLPPTELALIIPPASPPEEEISRGAPAGDFPPLPPDPYAQQRERLPPLDEELYHHGGSFLYQPEGDRWNWPEDDHDGRYELLRLPEDWQKPRPLTFLAEFLGADPIRQYPHLNWPGHGYSWEPRFVAYGSYEVFGIALEQEDERRDGIGHQLLVDLDLRLTGTERFHVQFRPLGQGNTGGSFYQFSDPAGYIDNSTGEPDRYWLEGELGSVLGAFLDPFAAWDYHVVAGKFPFVLQNFLLMNDDILGVAINKNNIYLGDLSNLNVQVFYAFNAVDALDAAAADGRVYGVNVAADYRRVFYEATYAFLENEDDASRSAHFAALSRTKHKGPTAVALRALFKWGDEGGTGSGQLFVVESNRTRHFEENWAAVEYGVFYCNAFLATQGWNSISGGNFDRLRSAFEVNPLVAISAQGAAVDTWGLAMGVQLFRHHEDESILPEVAFQAPGGVGVWGFGLRYLRKTGPRSFLELLGTYNTSDDPAMNRKGVFLGETILF